MPDLNLVENESPAFFPASPNLVSTSLATLLVSLFTPDVSNPILKLPNLSFIVLLKSFIPAKADLSCELSIFILASIFFFFFFNNF